MKKIMLSFLFIITGLSQVCEARPKSASDRASTSSTKKAKPETREVQLNYSYIFADSVKEPRKFKKEIRPNKDRSGSLTVKMSITMEDGEPTIKVIRRIANELGIKSPYGLKLKIGEVLQDKYINIKDFRKARDVTLYTDYSGLR